MTEDPARGPGDDIDQPPAGRPRTPLVIVPRGQYRMALVAMVLLGIGAVCSSAIGAFSAGDAHSGFSAVADDNDRLNDQLDCRAKLNAEVQRVTSEIVTAQARAISAAIRRDRPALDTEAAAIDQLAVALDVANDRRERATDLCDTGPATTLG